LRGHSKSGTTPVTLPNNGSFRIVSKAFSASSNPVLLKSNNLVTFYMLSSFFMAF
jgi:hypothetical protein